MKVLVDGVKQDILFDKGTQLEGIIDNVFRVMGKESRIIKSITVDEVLVTDKNADALMKKTAAKVKTMEVRTDTPINLAVSTLERAEKYLDTFKTQLNRFSSTLQTGGQEEDFDTFISGLKGWENVVQLLDIVRDMLKLDYRSMKVQGFSPDKLNDEVQKTLNQIKTALQNNDIVYLRDVIQYEMVPNVDKMKGVVVAVSRVAKQQAG